MQICRHADGKKWAISYPDLRLLLNVDSPKKKGSTESKQRIRANSVPRYHEFRRRVLDVARDELLLMVQNNTTNYYFTYTSSRPTVVMPKNKKITLPLRNDFGDAIRSYANTGDEDDLLAV